jgi:hypothetical protein
MALPESVPPAVHFPHELTTALMADAFRGADRVGQFLADLGLWGDTKKPLALPLRFLLHLCAALRLCEWEEQGWFFHRAVGLPEAAQAIREAFQSLTNPDAKSTELYAAVLGLFAERFAWHARRELDADVALDDLADEAALDALAAFLWATRHGGAVTQGPQP